MNTFLVNIRYDDTSFEAGLELQSECNKVEDVLEQIFAQWNNGSGMESAAFLASHCRSLSVGDYVKIDNQWYKCAGMGWKDVNQSDVDLWFNTMEDIRKNRMAGRSYEDELSLRHYDKLNAQKKLGMSYFS